MMNIKTFVSASISKYSNHRESLKLTILINYNPMLTWNLVDRFVTPAWRPANQLFCMSDLQMTITIWSWASIYVYVHAWNVSKSSSISPKSIVEQAGSCRQHKMHNKSFITCNDILLSLCRIMQLTALNLYFVLNKQALCHLFSHACLLIHHIILQMFGLCMEYAT